MRALVLLRVEGLALGAVSVWGFHLTGASWWLFAALALAPDLATAGYLAGPVVGAACYNAVHTYATPALLAAAAVALGPAASGWTLPAACVWAAHVGFDRALGYGLKLPEGFGHTHLGTVGRPAA